MDRLEAMTILLAAVDSGSGASPVTLAAADDAGDHVNLTPAGYAALAQAIAGCAGCLSPPAMPPVP